MLKPVARPKSPDGKRVPMSVRFSEPEAEEIDAARGSMDRGSWLREAALAAARPPGLHPLPQIQARGRVKSGTPPTMPPEPPLPRPRKAPAPVRFREPEPERTPKNCKHPNFRGVKGVCPDCCEWVTGKPRT